MQTLSRHKAVVAHQAYPMELAYAQYNVCLFDFFSRTFDISKLSAYDPSFSRDAATLNYFYPRFSESDPWFAATYSKMKLDFVRDATTSFYNFLGANQQKKPSWFLEKVSSDFVHFDLFRQIFSETKLIFLVRDLRDVICSIRSFNEARGYAAFGAQLAQSDQGLIDFYADAAGNFIELWRRHKDAGIVLRYEDFVRCREETLSKVFAWLGCSAETDMIERVLEPPRDGVGAAHMTSRTGSSSLGRWKTELGGASEYATAKFRPYLELFYGSSA
jgi:hypothetical protein